MNKIATEKTLQPLQHNPPQINNTIGSSNLIIHYPTLLVVVMEDENQHNIMF